MSMDQKILKAIQRGLYNALSTDIEDQDINFGHSDINSYVTNPEFVEAVENRDLDKILKMYKEDRYKYKVHSKEELRSIICDLTTIENNKFTLNWVDVSDLTDLSFLFSIYTPTSVSMFDRLHYYMFQADYGLHADRYNGDISEWDVSNVTNMDHMFDISDFNGDISKWNVSNVTSMQHMFAGSKFNQDISGWNVSNVIDMHGMFLLNKAFDKPINKWNVSNVIDMTSMFNDSIFNQDISDWDVINVMNMNWMFANSKFNQPLDKWKDRLHNVQTAKNIFEKSEYKQDLTSWVLDNPDMLIDMHHENMFTGSPLKRKVKFENGRIISIQKKKNK